MINVDSTVRLELYVPENECYVNLNLQWVYVYSGTDLRLHRL